MIIIKNNFLKKMDDDIIKFLEALSCIFPVMLCYVCYICNKVRQDTPLLVIETNKSDNQSSFLESIPEIPEII